MTSYHILLTYTSQSLHPYITVHLTFSLHYCTHVIQFCVQLMLFSRNRKDHLSQWFSIRLTIFILVCDTSLKFLQIKNMYHSHVRHLSHVLQKEQVPLNLCMYKWCLHFGWLHPLYHKLSHQFQLQIFHCLLLFYSIFEPKK